MDSVKYTVLSSIDSTIEGNSRHAGIEVEGLTVSR